MSSSSINLNILPGRLKKKLTSGFLNDISGILAKYKV
jgi:hypothetical protein